MSHPSWVRITSRVDSTRAISRAYCCIQNKRFLVFFFVCECALLYDLGTKEFLKDKTRVQIPFRNAKIIGGERTLSLVKCLHRGRRKMTLTVLALWFSLSLLG
jgi:hypothetical protein